MVTWEIAELATRLGASIEPGTAETKVLTGVLGLAEAGPSHLSFLANRRYLRQLRSTQAGAALVTQDTSRQNTRDIPAHLTLLRCKDPYAAFARALQLFHPQPRPQAGIDPRAVVEGQAEGATVMAFAYVGPNARVGPGTVLQPFVFVGEGAVIGRDCTLMAGSVVMPDCVVGDRTVLNPGAVIGSEGFGFAPTAEGLVKIPQVGRAVIGSDVEVGANSCVDRAAMGETRVGNGTKLDNFVQVGHAATVGDHSTLVAYAAVAGSAQVGNQVTLAARSLVLGHIEVGDRSQLGACSMLTESTHPGEQRSGIPAISHLDWLKFAAQARRLPELIERVNALERALQASPPKS